MKKEKLMIGDWVSVSGTPMRIAELGIVRAGLLDENEEMSRAGLLDENEEMSYNSYAIIEPIPLTAEIFEKNGFQKNKISNYETRYCIECGYNVLYVQDIGIQEFYVGNSSDEEGDLQDFATIKYVHELQHALRLCGITHEIII